MYRKSGRSTFAMTSGDSWSLRGKTNQEAKNAGTNHGSQTIVACGVSIRMPA